MNPLDAQTVRLGIYIGQLETQISELHKQLLEKSKEVDDLKSQLTEKGWELVAKIQKKNKELDELQQQNVARGELLRRSAEES
jgi:septal ring factor EnvC (AmiA/AmiB activator)